MLATPMTTQYSSPNDDVFKHEMTSNLSPPDGYVGLPPPPPPPPAPPVFNNNNNNINNNNNSNSKILLPHQEVNIVVNRANVTEIQARSVPSVLITGSNIWTRRVLPNLRIKQTIFDQHYGETKSTMQGHYRRASLSTAYTGGGGVGGGGGVVLDDTTLSFILLDATSKMLYDVPMRHLLQMVKKDHDDDASIDHVIRAIDETHMKSEWLDAVTALNKQFDKRPEDKAKVLAHKGSTHGLVLTEQFFVKLVRVPAYEFKLIFLKFREEAPAQLERMSKHIHDLLDGIQTILNNEQLPGILHLLCLLYNSITGKSIPGLHFDSLLSVLSTRTPKQNNTIGHVLCHLLEDQYPALMNIFDDQNLLKLKDLNSVKYIPIYIDIRLLMTRYKQLTNNLRDLQQQFIFLPEHIKTTLIDIQVTFVKLMDDEQKLKKGEKDLAAYFCAWDLSLELCLSTIGNFIDKLRLAHMQNVEQRRRLELLAKQQRTLDQRSLTPSTTTTTTSRSFRNSHNQYGSDTNIFRDHLNVPVTPMTARQRYKVNKIFRDRHSVSSRDVSYAVEEQQQQQIESTTTTIRTQNLLPNAVPRKRGHSPTVRTVLNKRPFNALAACTTATKTSTIDDKQQTLSDDVFISTMPDNEHEDEVDTKMDCTTSSSSTNETDTDDDHLLPSSIESSAIIPTTRAISVCEIQPSFYLTTPVRRLFNSSSSNDHHPSTNNGAIVPVAYENPNLTPTTSNFQHVNYPDNDDDNEKENNKENTRYSTTLTPHTSSSSSTNELPSSSNAIDDDSQPGSSSSSSSPAENSNCENRIVPTIPLSDSETLDEGFETQSNVSETVESTTRSGQLEIVSIENNETNLLSTDETLADELTRRLTFNSTRRLSHDSNNNSKRTSLSNGRPSSLLKTSTSAYSCSAFISTGPQQQNSTFAVRTPSVESLRSMTSNNNGVAVARSSRHIQRCAVSRRIWTEKDGDDASKGHTTSPPPPPTQSTAEQDEISSSSTITTTTSTTPTTTTSNRRIPLTKSKTKLRNLHLMNSNNTLTNRSQSPIVPKPPSRLAHASSCQNVSQPPSNSPKSSPLNKTRSPPSFFLNSSQIIRSSFVRPSEKPLRAFQMSTTIGNNNEIQSPNRPSPRTRRLFSSSSDAESMSNSSPKTSYKTPSSWHHHQLTLQIGATTTPKNYPASRATLASALPSTSSLANRKTSASTVDLHKSNVMNSSSVFQRSKRL